MLPKLLREVEREKPPTLIPFNDEHLAISTQPHVLAAGNVRFEIWEGKHWHWGYGNKRGDAAPQTGDTIVFFYARSGGTDPGIYGWAVLERCDVESKTLYFIPVASPNRLKMDPLWDDETGKLADDIRGPMKQATLFEIGPDDTPRIRQGIRRWLSCAE